MTQKKLTARHYFPGLVKKTALHHTLKYFFREIKEKIEYEMMKDLGDMHGGSEYYNISDDHIEDLRRIAFLCIRGDSCWVGIIAEILHFLTELKETPSDNNHFDLYKEEIELKHSFMKELRKVLTDWGQGDFPDNPEETQNSEEE